MTERAPQAFVDRGEPPEEDYPTPESPQIEYESEAEVEPVAVYLVDQQERRQSVGWRGSVFFIDSSQTVQLAGKDRDRTRLYLYNAGPETVYLDSSRTMVAGFSYALTANTALELTHNDNVFAICASTETASVSVASEFVTDSDDRD